MKTTIFLTSLLCADHALASSVSIDAMAPPHDIDEKVDESSNPQEVPHQPPSEEPNADQEAMEKLYWQCRRNPTWTTGGVDYSQCMQLASWYGYKPRHTYVHDVAAFDDVDKINELEECLHDAFEEKEWSECGEGDSQNEQDPHCVNTHAHVGSQYQSVEEGNLAVVHKVLNEQEIFGLEALSACVRSDSQLSKDEAFVEERPFDSPSDEEYGLYKYGGNHVVYLSGLLTILLPGVAASIFNAMTTAYNDLDWHHTGVPNPDTLGLRTAEFLEYHKTGRLGTHIDSGSHFSISIALGNETAYDGGYFRLETEQAMFKVPQQSAVVFFSERAHGVTPIHSGNRKVFVVEIWDEEDLPPGYGRSDPEHFKEYKDRFAQYEQDESFVKETVEKTADSNGKTTEDKEL